MIFLHPHLTDVRNIGIEKQLQSNVSEIRQLLHGSVADRSNILLFSFHWLLKVKVRGMCWYE